MPIGSFDCTFTTGSSLDSLLKSFTANDYITIVNNHKDLKPEMISVKGVCTIVHWNDGTTTTVRLSNEDMMRGMDSIYHAFCCALAKKIYGTNSSLTRMINDCLESTINEKKEEEERKKVQEELAKQKRNHLRKIKRMAKEIAKEQEALEYYLTHYATADQIKKYFPEESNDEPKAEKPPAEQVMLEEALKEKEPDPEFDLHNLILKYFSKK